MTDAAIDAGPSASSVRAHTAHSHWLPVAVRRRYGSLTVDLNPRFGVLDNQSPPPTHTVIYVLRGQVTVAAGLDRVEVGGEELCILQGTEGLQLRQTPDALVLVLRLTEAATSPYRTALDSVRGTRWDATVSTASLVAHLLDGLVGQLDDYKPREPHRVAFNIVSILALLCSEKPTCNPADWKNRIREAAKDYIEHHLSDLELGPDSIARELGVSTRTLHRLFQAEGSSVSRWIRHRRLENCRADLDNSYYDDDTVSSIGSRWGLWDAANLSRLFKADYGVSPRQYREQARQQR